MTKRLLAALCAVLMMGSTLAVASTVGAQEPANPWYVDKYEPAEYAEIEEVRANGRVAFNVPMGRVYGDATHDFYVLTAGGIETFCLGDPPRSETLIGYRQSGEFVMRTPPGGIDVITTVYVRPEGADDIFAWLGEQCGAWETDGTPLPAPIASGFANLRINTTADVPFWADLGAGGVRRNGVTGTLSDADGNLWDLSTRAVFPFDPERQAPPEFTRHDVSLTPSAG